MPDLLRLPLRIADYGTRPARFVVGRLLALRRSGEAARDAAPAVATPAPEPPRTAPSRPAPSRPSPKAARRATRHEPTHGEAAAIRAKDHPTGPTIEVAPPWDHYDSMTEEQVLDRLIGAEPTLRAMVRLCESQHAGRPQVLLATEETSVT